MDDDAKTATGGTEDQEEPRVFSIATLGGRRAFVETLAKGVAVGTAVIAAGSCDKKSGDSNNPSSPSGSRTASTTTTTATPTWTLSGTVTDSSTGKPVTDATVTVTDGPNANRSTTTDGNGYFSLSGLTQSGFTIRIVSSRYEVITKGIGLTSNITITIVLVATTSTTTTRPTTSTPTTTGGGGGTVHYWYPC